MGLVTILTEREEDKESLAAQVWGVPYDKHMRAVPYAVARHFYYDCELVCPSSSPLNRKHTTLRYDGKESSSQDQEAC